LREEDADLNKTEKIIVALLFITLIAWFIFYRPVPPSPPPHPPSGTGRITQGEADTNKLETSRIQSAEGTEMSSLVSSKIPDERVSTEPVVEEPEELVQLSNEEVTVILTSRGASIKSVILHNYRAKPETDSVPLELKFDSPALAIYGIKGLSTNVNFRISKVVTNEMVLFEKELHEGIKFIRTVTLTNSYKLLVDDTVVNSSTNQYLLPEMNVSLGSMRDDTPSTKESNLGIDTLSAGGGEDVIYWAVKGPPEDSPNLTMRFQPPFRRGGCEMFKPKLVTPLPKNISIKMRKDTAWVALKNRFFVQILAPLSEEAKGFTLVAHRFVPATEKPTEPETWVNTPVIEKVEAECFFNSKIIQPLSTFQRNMSFYIGPMKYSILKQLGRRQDRVMFRVWKGWEWFRSICIALLSILNFFYAIIPNYGIAIILLTLLIRIVFWPLTYKMNINMKKLQALKPELDELQRKYKDNPRRLQREQLELYRKHKINPLGAAGCLPVLIQMPVFIALFNVLKGAIELRFARFLWIKDLSMPEGLLADVLPIPLNILPIIMTITSYIQQKVTPSTNDPQQKQMMFFMPVFFLFLLYNMASGLVLYWTVSQLLAIGEIKLQNYLSKPHVNNSSPSIA
jgi:YidC/Oxa1 family membrane protein insertase